MAFASAASAANTVGDTSKDVEVAELPGDSISDLAFSPTNDHLAVASWDKKVYIYEVGASGAQGKWSFEMGGPVLGCAWSADGTRVAGASTDRSVHIVDLRQAPGGGNCQTTQVAQHDDAVKSVRWFTLNGADYIATGSWDKTVKFWDLRSPTPAGQINASERVYSMDVKNDLLVVGTAERHIHVVDLKEPTKIYKTIQSPLKWQTRVVSCFTDATGFAVGSIEGRCAIQYVEDKDTALNFSFKCHRQQDPANRDVAKVYSVNAISFHPQHGTFSTAGSDGTFHFWDKDAKHRLKGYPEAGGSITATGFNHTGNIFAYAVSYDWSKGYAFNNPQQPIKLKLHPIAPEECKPRPGGKKR
ncbi:Poly(A)+ RNA export protein-like protein [Delitschia confertaspora ATCC 74209]|uniref:Poly(A)+ RNA export protein-like protein n=1 Tax=Delitschia confertaspora ATCC 74209 TaxID=1513339 RepID=A0A9P4MT02_9PLEO|nr:Poly(A)+ RNA export protein-like protein [Delitschia confertaspora ATCC 74209]